MQTTLKTTLGLAGLLLATQAIAQVTFYAGENFRGPAFTADRTIWNFDQTGFNDRARSAVVNGGSWQVCEDARFAGRCLVLQPGNYPTLADVGMDKRISSVRPFDPNARYGYDAPIDAPLPPVAYDAPPPAAYGAPPPPASSYDYRPRPNEQLFQATVTSVHAVVGPPEQRCWVERQEVYDDRGRANIPGAIVGAIVGGVLGHQVGGGRGRDVATAGGAVAGAAIGANVGRDRSGSYSQDVQRCATVQGQGPPDYWDVTYDFDGVQHRVQLNSPPGPTITVNSNGEPRM